jgi:predicted lipoprotein with Yx(FWY)xxD motif
MPRFPKQARARRRVSLTLVLAVMGTGAIAVAVAIAAGKSFTLEMAKNASVTNQQHATTHETIAVNSRGFAVYWLSGDSRQHPECTSATQCLHFWPPVTAASAQKLTKDPAIKGKLTSWRRGGFVQAVLGGHPLYTFSADTRRRAATGEGVVAFGGTWHVLGVAAPKHSATTNPPSTNMGTTTTSTSPYGPPTTSTGPYGY